MFSVYFENPWVLWLIIPFLIGLVLLIKFDFVKIKEDAVLAKRRRSLKNLMLFTRGAICVLLIVALAYPYIPTQKVIQGEPHVKILVDKTGSFKLFDLGFVEEFKKNLGRRVDVDVSYIEGVRNSPIGDSLFKSLKENEHILLISDGNNNFGTSLGDVASYAVSLNTTINALNLNAKEYDASVYIEGPQKTSKDVENTFNVVVEQAGEKREVPLTVLVDGKAVLTTLTREGETFVKTFEKGYHRIEAKIEANDFFKQNNAFYKTIKVVEKPKVLFITEKESPLVKLFNPIYDIVTGRNIDSLDVFPAVVLNDINEKQFNAMLSKLTNFAAEGNGLVVVGGTNSYDGGNYKNSAVESLLPVRVAKAGKKAGEANIVVVIDVSGSTGERFGGAKKVDVEKALTIEVLNDLSPISKVGIVAFNTKPYLVADINMLMNQEGLNEKISRLVDGGGTMVSVGLLAGVQMLEGVSGSKNIILISDGNTQQREETMGVAKYAADNGITVYTVGVGYGTNEELMSKLADIGNGAYFQPGETEKIRILFGGVDKEKGEKGVYNALVFNENHFITGDIKLDARLYGFNLVAPKSNGKLLVTTDMGDPLVTVGRFGLGRVVAVTTDDGGLYAGELLNKKNSKLWTRMMNFAIGDPERKNDQFILVDDSILGENTEILLKSSIQPSTKNVPFYKIDENLYKATIRPSEIGFNKILDAIFGVNYLAEYQHIGLNPELRDFVSSTNGKIFEKDDIEGIAKHIIANSKRVVSSKKNYVWIFVIFAVIVYLFEIFMRRVIANKKVYKE